MDRLKTAFPEPRNLTAWFQPLRKAALVALALGRKRGAGGVCSPPGRGGELKGGTPIEDDPPGGSRGELSAAPGTARSP